MTGLISRRASSLKLKGRARRPARCIRFQAVPGRFVNKFSGDLLIYLLNRGEATCFSKHSYRHLQLQQPNCGGT
jgi:hypothetical protein